MQLTITFKKDRITLPMANAHILQGLIYKALREDARYSKDVHDCGHALENKRFKHFTFSELKGKYETEGKNIVYLGKATLRISSAEDYFIELLFSYFKSSATVRLGEWDVEVANVRLENKCIFEDEVKIRTVSPITVYYTEDDGHTVYHSPTDEKFYSAIVRNAQRKWQAAKGDDADFDFEITEAADARFVKRATRFKDTFITAWHGTFILKGTPEVLNFLLNTGLGSKNSEGFGMFTVEE